MELNHKLNESSADRQPTVMLVDDEPNILKTLDLSFQALGCEVLAFSDPRMAIDALDTGKFDLAFVDLAMEPVNGLDVLKAIRRRAPETTVVIMSAHGQSDHAMEAVKLGAFYYLEKPFDFQQLRLFVGKAVERNRLERELNRLRDQLENGSRFGEVKTRSHRLIDILDSAVHAADSDAPVFLQGDSGTGKELIARLIHQKSPRAGKRFTPVRCAGQSAAEVEALLFGNLELEDGTVYLENPAHLSEALQVRLVKALETGYQARLISASNQNMEAAVREGSFRNDLFDRLASVWLRIPSLIDRPEDIPLLVQHFLQRYSNGHTADIRPEAMSALQSHHWSGNIDELENVVQRALLVAGGGAIEFEHLDDAVRRSTEPKPEALSLEEVEKRYILQVLEHAATHDDAARILGVDTATLWRKRKRLGIA